MTNTKFREYPFTIEGVNFISKVDTTHPIYTAVEKLTDEQFSNLHTLGLMELLGGIEISLDNLQEIQDNLNRINEGGSWAFLTLGQNLL